MAGLIHVGLQTNIRTALQGFIIDDIAEINSCLSSFSDYPDGAPILIENNIYKGRRPTIRNLRNFPAITIFSNSRSNEWIASRTTDETVSCSIFCCVKYTEVDYVEDLMEYFSETISAVLFKHPKYDFTIVQDNVSQIFGVYDARPTNIQFGSVDNGAIRCGEISYTAKMYLHQEQSYT